METVEATNTTESLAEAASQTLNSGFDESHDDSVKVSASNNEGLNSNIDSRGRRGVVITRSVLETEVSVEKVLEDPEMAVEKVQEVPETAVEKVQEDPKMAVEKVQEVLEMVVEKVQEDPEMAAEKVQEDQEMAGWGSRNETGKGFDSVLGFEKLEQNGAQETAVEKIQEMVVEKIEEGQEMAGWGGGKATRKGFESILGVEKMEVNQVQENGTERDVSILIRDSLDNKKLECNGNGFSLLVEGQGSLASENEVEKNFWFEDDKGGDTYTCEKSTEISHSKQEVNGDEGENTHTCDRGGDTRTCEKSIEISDSKQEVNGNEEENNQYDGEDESDEEDHEYIVGDFVWGKISSYPWWPGQIYDPSDASDYANKVKHKEGCLLVAYFGDGSFSWCSPSQLKPFAENFEEMSNQSNSKNFVSAVEKALDEIGRLIEVEMTCECITTENRIKDARPMNGGIKAGVLVPKGKYVRLLIARMEPAELLSNLKYAAKLVSITGVLDLTVLKSWLTAFYIGKGGYLLPIYHEPKGIEGLEDKMRNNGIIRTDDFSEPVIVPIQGPSEEHGLSSPVGLGSGQSNQWSLSKCLEIADVKYQRRKKQKSVAELMGEEDIAVDPKQKVSLAKEGTKKMRKGKDEAENWGNSSLSTLSSGKKRKRKDEVDGKQEIVESSALRERKKSKYLSPPYTTPDWRVRNSSSSQDSETETEKIAKVAQMGERMTRVACQLIGSPLIHKEIDATVNTNEVLSELLYVALDPFNSRKKKQLEMITGFFVAFRSSLFLNGSNYKTYHKRRAGKKRSRLTPGSENKMNKKEELDMPKIKQAMNEEANKRDSPVTLVMTFPPAFALPSKDHLVKIFSKFGDLKEAETYVSYNSFSARVVFVKSSDAEEAIKVSQANSPFGAANVSYRLRDSLTSRKASSALKKTAKTGEASGLGFIKQKLKKMNSMVENCDGKFTAEMKSSMVGGLKELLEKVSMTAPDKFDQF